MKARSLFFVVMALSVCFVTGAAEAPQLTRLKKAPAGLAEKISATLDPAGYRLDGPDGAVIEFWLAKSLSVKPAFKPTLTVKYPFTPGQLIGALRIPAKSKFTDFRGQEMPAGVYTLRYGQQPEDGNHIGTSETADFLLTLPGKIDTDPKPITSFDKLSESSAKSASSTHPAIFSLLTLEKPPKKATLTHDEEHDFWIVSLVAQGSAKDKPVKVPFRFIAIGRALE